MIQGVSKVVVPVADQERAKRFWTQQLGFTVAVDEGATLIRVGSVLFGA